MGVLEWVKTTPGMADITGHLSGERIIGDLVSRIENQGGNSAFTTITRGAKKYHCVVGVGKEGIYNVYVNVAGKRVVDAYGTYRK